MNNDVCVCKRACYGLLPEDRSPEDHMGSVGCAPRLISPPN